MFRIVVLFLVSSLFPHQLISQQTVGLFKNDSTAFNGYTLFSPTAYHTTFLIDNCGEAVHSWTSDYKPGLIAYLLENGQLLRTAQIPSPFTGGGGGGRLELMDWDGTLIWSYNYSSPTFHQHHDIEILPNGNILVLAWEAIPTTEAVANGRIQIGEHGLWSEKIVELKMIGTDSAQIVWEWRLWDHLIQNVDDTKPNYGTVAQHPERMNINFPHHNGNLQSPIDWMHFNSIDYHPELDQILMSSRSSNEIYIIDHSTTTEQAASNTGGNAQKGGDFLYRWGNPIAYDRGSSDDQKFFRQHDAHWIAAGQANEGQIMVFNNGIERPTGNFSSIDRIETPLHHNENYTLPPQSSYGPVELSWTYTLGNNPLEFYARRMSGAQQLPNGNILICDGPSGHFFEVKPDGRIVWDYVNPVRQGGSVNQGNTVSSNGVFRVHRYGVDFPAFADKELLPMGPLELEPLATDCQIFEEDVVNSDHKPSVLPMVKVLTNPIRDQLKIQNSNNSAFQIEILDATGQLIFHGHHQGFDWSYPTSNWVNGLYFIRISNFKTHQTFIQKIIKH